MPWQHPYSYGRAFSACTLGSAPCSSSNCTICVSRFITAAISGVMPFALGLSTHQPRSSSCLAASPSPRSTAVIMSLYFGVIPLRCEAGSSAAICTVSTGATGTDSTGAGIGAGLTGEGSAGAVTGSSGEAAGSRSTSWACGETCWLMSECQVCCPSWATCSGLVACFGLCYSLAFFRLIFLHNRFRLRWLGSCFWSWCACTGNRGNHRLLGRGNTGGNSGRHTGCGHRWLDDHRFDRRHCRCWLRLRGQPAVSPRRSGFCIWWLIHKVEINTASGSDDEHARRYRDT